MTEFITSDWHLGHHNICGTNAFVPKRKQFKDVDEMNEKIIDVHNKYVNNDDTTFMLGDISLNLKPREVFELIKKMKGHFIFISGNHDSSKIKKYFLSNNYKMPDGQMKIIGYEDVGFRRKVGGKVYLMTHYPMHVGDYRAIHRSFFGHIHDDKAVQSTGFHVGIDSTELPESWEFSRPIPFEQAIEWIEEKHSTFMANERAEKKRIKEEEEE